MPYGFRRALFLASLGCTLAGCTTVQATRDASVRYNAAFADARNQIPLVNILRARDQMPVQFSTISNVTGPMRANVDVTAAWEWVFHDKDKVTPGGTFTFRNPAVTLTPLDSKEFVQGMATPITAAQVDQLLAEGWDRGAVLNLVIAGVDCDGTGSSTVLNDANPDDQSAAFKVSEFELLASGAQWNVNRTKDSSIGILQIPADAGLKAIKEGVSDDYKLAPVKTRRPAKSIELELKQAGEPIIEGLHLSRLCPGIHEGAHTFVVGPSERQSGKDSGPKIFLRSPAGMIIYLGRLMNLSDRQASRGAPSYSRYFRVFRAPPGYVFAENSPYAAVRAEYLGGVFYIPPAVGYDRTLQTFGILTEIISLQTTQATLDQSKPALTVSAD